MECYWMHCLVTNFKLPVPFRLVSMLSSVAMRRYAFLIAVEVTSSSLAMVSQCFFLPHKDGYKHPSKSLQNWNLDVFGSFYRNMGIDYKNCQKSHFETTNSSKRRVALASTPELHAHCDPNSCKAMVQWFIAFLPSLRSEIARNSAWKCGWQHPVLQEFSGYAFMYSISTLRELSSHESKDKSWICCFTLLNDFPSTSYTNPWSSALQHIWLIYSNHLKERILQIVWVFQQKHAKTHSIAFCLCSCQLFLLSFFILFTSDHCS